MHFMCSQIANNAFHALTDFINALTLTLTLRFHKCISCAHRLQKCISCAHRLQMHFMCSQIANNAFHAHALTDFINALTLTLTLRFHKCISCAHRLQKCISCAHRLQKYMFCHGHKNEIYEHKFHNRANNQHDHSSMLPLDYSTANSPYNISNFTHQLYPLQTHLTIHPILPAD
jgi:hypothetical protein